MNRLLAPVLCCVVLGGLAFGQEKPKDVKDAKEGKDSFEAVIADLIATIKKASDTLKTAKDEKSAKEAKSALAKVGEEMQKLKTRGEKLGQATKEQEDQMEKKFKAEMEASVKSFQVEAERVAKQPWGKELLDALKPKAAAPADKPKTPSAPKKNG